MGKRYWDIIEPNTKQPVASTKAQRLLEHMDKKANPEETSHDVLLGWEEDNGKPGCGVRWEYVSSNYEGDAVIEWCARMCPDLEYITFYTILKMYENKDHAS